MSALPTVSVVIPSLNAAPYIRQTIDSVLAQTHSVLEILVVDGGSTDGTREIVAGYGEPVRLMDQQAYGRKGIAAGRNIAIDVAKGEWIALLDADDWWDERKLQIQLAALERCPGAALCYTASWVVFDETGERVFHAVRDSSTIWPSLRWNNQISNSTVLMRRAAIQKVGGHREDIIGFEDWEMWVRLRRHYTFVSVPEALLFARILPNSVSHDVKKHVNGIPEVIDAMLSGVTGWKRWVYGRRVWATQLRGAAIVAQMNGTPSRELIWRSVLRWPSPVFFPDRYILLAKALTGTAT